MIPASCVTTRWSVDSAAVDRTTSARTLVRARCSDHRGTPRLATHFAVSVALAVQLSPPTAETIGIFKELRDAQGGTGFSFIDLQADLAGVAFARHVQQGRPSLETLAASFALTDFVPPPHGLQEGFAWQAFTAAYGSVQDDRFLLEVARIRERILGLPGYQGGRPLAFCFCTAMARPPLSRLSVPCSRSTPSVNPLKMFDVARMQH